MEQALINFFSFVINSFGVPIRNAILNTNLFDTLRNFLNGFLSCIFKLWNNDNITLDNFFDRTNFAGFISEIFSILFIVFILKITISIFNVLFNTIRGNLK